MPAPLINILVRMSRPEMVPRWYGSILQQEYTNYKIHTFKCPGNVRGYDYNLYCNILKAQVESGWFFFLDDDDKLAHPLALSNMARFLINEDIPVVCQMLRNGYKKPTDSLIDRCEVVRGYIGMPCIFMPAKHKYLVDFNNREDADFSYIKTIASRLSVAFVKEVVVDAGSRSRGARYIKYNIKGYE